MTHDHRTKEETVTDRLQLEALEKQLASVSKQLKAQRDAFDRRGRRLIELQNASFALRNDPATRFRGANIHGAVPELAKKELGSDREARFRETEVLTRRLIEVEDRLEASMRQLAGVRFIGIKGAVRAIIKKLRRR